MINGQFLEHGSYNMYTRSIRDVDICRLDPLHTHFHHEMFMVLEGEVEYQIEGTVYPLKAGDIVVIGAGEPHSKYRAVSENLTIFVVMVDKSFFKEIGCPEYENIFNTHTSTEHLISAKTARDSGIGGVYRRLASYTQDFSEIYTQIAKFTLAEFLYLLNKNDFSHRFIANEQIKYIIDFINANYRRKITIEEIAGSMFLSKYYICKLFKKHTGITIKSYITQKRLASVNILANQGYNITSACINSGFPDYSSFYHAFMKENGRPPKAVLKR